MDRYYYFISDKINWIVNNPEKAYEEFAYVVITNKDLLIWTFIILTLIYVNISEVHNNEKNSKFIKNMKNLENENKRLKLVLENLMQRQEAFEENFNNRIINRKNDNKDELDKIHNDMKEKYQQIEKIISLYKKEQIMIKTRITKLKNFVEDKFEALEELDNMSDINSLSNDN